MRQSESILSQVRIPVARDRIRPSAGRPRSARARGRQEGEAQERQDDAEMAELIASPRIVHPLFDPYDDVTSAQLGQEF